MDPRQMEVQSFRTFAQRHGLGMSAEGGLPLHGMLNGVPFAVSKVVRGTRNPTRITQFLAAVPVEVPGGLVVYKPNFRWRLPGSRVVSDDVGVGGLLGFVHHDSVGDPELDTKLVIQADDVSFARSLLTTPDVKRSILNALGAAGHLRLLESKVALDVSERRSGLLRLMTTVDEVENLAHAATGVAVALWAAVSACRRS
jgi:hypothetical protein